jgi:hypothetical protein
MRTLILFGFQKRDAHVLNNDKTKTSGKRPASQILISKVHCVRGVDISSVSFIDTLVQKIDFIMSNGAVQAGAGATPCMMNIHFERLKEGSSHEKDPWEHSVQDFKIG